ncbi:hypothetical protein BH23BAC2_BH23BAC2_26640 [soil metagenome]
MLSKFEFADNVLGIIIDIDINKLVLGEVHDLIQQKIDQNHCINLFVEIKPGVKIPVDIMIKDLIFKLGNNDHFKKMAIVAEAGIFEKSVRFKDFLMKAEIQTFSHKDRLKAMNWIAQ